MREERAQVGCNSLCSSEKTRPLPHSYSIQGLKRKLGISDDEQRSGWQQEMDARAGQKRAREDQAESSEGEQPSLMVKEREPRRTRVPVNYFDTSAAHGQRRVMTETVLSELESAEASRSRRREGCVGLDFYSIVQVVQPLEPPCRFIALDQMRAQTSSSLAHDSRCSHAPLLQSVHIRHDGKEDEPLPWPSTRQALSSLLRSGKVRRRLALPLELQGSTANALHQLVMSTLQVRRGEGSLQRVGSSLMPLLSSPFSPPLPPQHPTPFPTS